MAKHNRVIIWCVAVALFLATMPGVFLHAHAMPENDHSHMMHAQQGESQTQTAEQKTAEPSGKSCCKESCACMNGQCSGMSSMMPSSGSCCGKMQKNNAKMHCQRKDADSVNPNPPGPPPKP